MTKAQIIFAEGGKSFHVLFPDNSKSLEITSQHDGLAAFIKLVDCNKIKSEECLEMIKIILEAKELPFRKPIEASVSVLLFSGCVKNKKM